MFGAIGLSVDGSSRFREYISSVRSNSAVVHVSAVARIIFAYVVAPTVEWTATRDSMHPCIIKFGSKHVLMRSDASAFFTFPYSAAL